MTLSANRLKISRPVTVALLLIIGFYLINGIFYLRAQSLTYDESSFLFYAARFIKGHPEKIYPQSDNSKLPVSVINLIPRAVNQVLHPGLKKTDNGLSDVFEGRYMTLLFSVFTILLVFHWSKTLYGSSAGLFSALLTSFCPNLLASAGLVTSDSYSVFMLLVTMFFLWKYFNSHATRDFIGFSCCVALSQLVKQSLFHLYIIFPIVFLVYYAVFRFPLNRKRIAALLLYFLFINWFIINLGFYFHETNRALGTYPFLSNSFLQVQQILPKWLPIPLPSTFIVGLDLSKYYDQIGGGDYVQSSFGKITILGKYANGGSFWYYYFVTLFFKTPIPYFVFITGGIWMIFKKQSISGFFKKEFFLVIPVIYFILFMSFFYKTQIGIRQMIFIYPFLFILSGNLIRYSKGFYARGFVAALTLFLMVSVMKYWRNYFPYTNEFIVDKKKAYQYVGCANLEFKQSQYFYDEYLKQHQDVRMAPLQPQTGTFLVYLDDYMDIWNLHRYDWISRIEPTGEVACNGLLVVVREADLKKSP
jgi:Dolichyl-phosphate-mannose-protein mannosyltransferase